jgi:hypothetical protein
VESTNVTDHCTGQSRERSGRIAPVLKSWHRWHPARVLDTVHLRLYWFDSSAHSPPTSVDNAQETCTRGKPINLTSYVATMPTKIALLGSGIFASQFYLPVLLKSAEVDLAALWSRSKTSVDKIASLVTASTHGDRGGDSDLKTYFGDDGFEALLADKDVQAVIMALPITAQPPIVLRCLEAGKHVLSEKPVAKDAHTARDLIERAKAICQANKVVWRVAESESSTTSSGSSRVLVSPTRTQPCDSRPGSFVDSS